VLQENRSRIQPVVHLHDRDSSLAVAGEDRALDRCRTAPARQQGGVNVERTARCDVEQRLRQDQAVSGDYEHLRVRGGDPLLHLRRLEAGRPIGRDPALLGKPLHGPRDRLQATRRRPLRLCKRKRNVVSRCE